MGSDTCSDSAGGGVDTHKLIGGVIKHICICNEDAIGKGVAVCVEKGGKEFTLHVYLPKNCPSAFDFIDIDEW